MEKVKLANIMQGEAEVLINGEQCGFVSRRYGTNADAGWHAYDNDGKHLSRFPSIKRDGAVAELVELYRAKVAAS